MARQICGTRPPSETSPTASIRRPSTFYAVCAARTRRAAHRCATIRALRPRVRWADHRRESCPGRAGVRADDVAARGRARARRAGRGRRTTGTAAQWSSDRRNRPQAPPGGPRAQDRRGRESAGRARAVRAGDARRRDVDRRGRSEPSSIRSKCVCWRYRGKEGSGLSDDSTGSGGQRGRGVPPGPPGIA